MRILWLLLAAFLLSGCGGGASLNNLPWSAYPTGYVDVPRLRIHVDQNGDFYPANWQVEPGYDEVREGRSLAVAHRGLPAAERGRILAGYRADALEQVRSAVQGRSRIFVLIHGFNAQPGSAGAGYAVIDRLIPFDRDRDLIIELYWDGFHNDGKRLNGARIWFPSAATSQMAGSRALRPILAQMRDAHVVLISHSRGASVSLSAFGNPSYTSEFRTLTRGAGLPEDYLSPPETDFSGANLRIDALMLAAAVGNPDFWSSSCTDARGCRDFRPLSGLNSIRYVRNPKDTVLPKRFIPFIPWSPACDFNATTLGYTEDCGSWVRDEYGSRLIAYPIAPMETHSFVCYAGHPVLRRMLGDIGVATRDPEATALPPWSCDNG